MILKSYEQSHTFCIWKCICLYLYLLFYSSRNSAIFCKNLPKNSQKFFFMLWYWNLMNKFILSASENVIVFIVTNFFIYFPNSAIFCKKRLKKALCPGLPSWQHFSKSCHRSIDHESAIKFHLYCLYRLTLSPPD